VETSSHETDITQMRATPGHYLMACRNLFTSCIWSIRGRSDRGDSGQQPGMITMIDVLNAKEIEASEITPLTSEEIDQVAGGSGFIRPF